jgi:N-acetylmuramoyl-L-alanine amidase
MLTTAAVAVGVIVLVFAVSAFALGALGPPQNAAPATGVNTTKASPKSVASSTAPAVSKPVSPVTSTPSPTPKKVAAAPSVSTASGVVVIDAGHQGTQDMKLEPIGPGSSQLKPRVESGTAGVVTRVAESVVNLQVALKLEKTLQSRGVKVIMIRTSQNVDIPNSKRAEIANNAHAALFIRLHCDGVGNSTTHGFLMLRPGANQWTGPIVAPSKVAANYVDKAVLAATGAFDRGTEARTDLAGFNWATVPTILVEMGVMTNPTEDRKLSTAAYQQTLADGMTNGIVQYLRTR